MGLTLTFYPTATWVCSLLAFNKGKRLHPFLKGNQLPETNPSNVQEQQLSYLWGALLLNQDAQSLCAGLKQIPGFVCWDTLQQAADTPEISVRTENTVHWNQCERCLSKSFPVTQSSFGTHSPCFSRINTLTYAHRFPICASGHNTL